jgi:hypothetical protein
MRAIYEPRSLVLAEIHAEPFLTLVPEPSAAEINGGVADISEIRYPAVQRWKSLCEEEVISADGNHEVLQTHVT